MSESEFTNEEILILNSIEKNKTKIYNFYHCETCNQNNNTIIDGIIICKNCNIDYGPIIDSSPEWRNYSSDANIDNSRCGGVNNPYLMDLCYGTTIGQTKNPLFIKLKQSYTWNISHIERTKKMIFNHISQKCKEYNLPLSVIEYSQELFSKICDIQNETDNKSSRGDFREGLIASCTLYACKELKISRTTKEIAEIFNINESDVTRGKKLFFELLEGKNLIKKNICDIYDFTERYCILLGINEEYIDKIKICYETIKKNNLLLKNTTQSILGGCIMFISNAYNLKVKIDQVSKVCKISQTTIKNIYNDIVIYSELLI